MQRNLDIVATLSASRVTPRWLEGFKREGATYFRINGAFESVDRIKGMVKALRKNLGSDARILLDIPRNKIRLSERPARPFKKGKTLRLGLGDVNFPQFFTQIKKGDILFAKDSKYRFVVDSSTGEKATLIAEQDGNTTPGMGLHRIGGWDGLPLFSDWDRQLLKVSKEFEIPYLGISYLRHAREIPEIVAAIGKSNPIFKIETYHAYNELSDILRQVETISVDRGDLSSEIGIENIHTAQQRIINQAKRRGTKVFLATQFLQNMVVSPLPSISEVTSLHEAFEDGIDGIQLSEETARGAFATGAVRWIKTLFSTWHEQSLKQKINSIEGAVIWLTGLSGSGKTTLARLAESKLKELGHRTVLIDGDDVRAHLDGIFGYETKDRILNQKNLIYLAQKLAETNTAVIVASLSPYAEMRQMARERIGKFIEVHVKCSLDECRRRDPKGLYAQLVPSGNHAAFIGVSQPYEEPERPDLVINTEGKDPAHCLNELLTHLKTFASA